MAAEDRRGDDHREAATGMDVDIVASTQEPLASITSGAAGHRRGNDTLQSRDLQHQSSASEGEPLDYEEGEQVSPTGSEEGVLSRDSQRHPWIKLSFRRPRTSRYIYNACDLLYVFGTACLGSMEVM